MTCPVEHDGIRLRDFRAGDLDNVELILLDDAVTAQLAARTGAGKTQRFLGDRLAAVENSDRPDYYLVAETIDGHFLGFVRIGIAGEGMGRLGVAIRSDEWRKGWATRVCGVAMRWSRDTLGLVELEAATAADNEKAKGLLDKLGFGWKGSTTEFEGAEGMARDVYAAKLSP